MDSISQIVLGAAVGEACLGRKIGNRAMLWGAVAGTIPDLDVIGNLWMSEIDSLAFHRGISHSLFFAFAFSFVIAWLVHKLYASDYYKSDLHRRGSGYIAIGAVVLVCGAAAVAAIKGGGLVGGLLVGAGMAALGSVLSSRIYKYYMSGEPIDVKVSYWQWYLFFFLTIFTHPLLDCCTAYGTQLWAPFSDVRIAWNNISVADPAWTLPFGLALIVAATCGRSAKIRRIWLLIGWLWAVGYMTWTSYNRHRVDLVMKATLSDMDIDYDRYTIGPSILNNVLWSGTVETSDTYYQGLYSLLDKEPVFKLLPVAKNYDLVEDVGSDEVLETLKWFTDGYYAYIRRDDGRIQMNDLRYGSTRADGPPQQDDFVFRFVLDRQADGSYVLSSSEGGPPRDREQEMITALMQRVRGI